MIKNKGLLERSMIVKEVTRKEIEARLKDMGDYVKMDYLESCLRKHLDFDTKKFILINLAALYENRKMYFDAGKAMRTAADINTTFQGNVTDFMRAIQLFIRSEKFDEVDITLSKALASADDKDRGKIKQTVKEFYKVHAKLCEQKGKKRSAAEAYERMLTLPVNEVEKQETKNSLMRLYNGLGKVREYYSVQRL